MSIKPKNSNNLSKVDINVEVDNIYNVDCNHLIKKMIKQNFIVDAIITDPPYNISRENNFKTIGRSGIDFGTWDKNFNQTKWLTNINKILKPGGSIIIFNDWRNLGEIAGKLEKEGFEIKDVLRWIKPAPMPRNVNRRYVSDFELAIWAVKPGAKWTFNKEEDKHYLRPEFKHSPPAGSNRIHPTQKSSDLIKDLINIHTNKGDIIFDPFSGSGEISINSFKLNRGYLGSEIDKKFFKLSLRRIKETYLKPAFNHLGNKHRMIENLLRAFPKKNIDYFVDVFAGSGIVSLSYKAPQKIFLNDNDKWLAKILEYLFNTNEEIVLSDIEEIIDKYKLPTEKKEYKKEYEKLRANFNKTKEVKQLLPLILFGFNQQIRFNSKKEFNIPVGKFYWNNYHKNKIINFIENAKNKNVVIRSQNFIDFIRDVKKEVDKEKTIFYFDPPYLLSNATYNSNWTKEDEESLVNLLQELTNEGYKWFLSNVIESKGSRNKFLENFISKNKSNLEIFEISVNYKNSNYQRNSNKVDKEILIKGYCDE